MPADTKELYFFCSKIFDDITVKWTLKSRDCVAYIDVLSQFAQPTSVVILTRCMFRDSV